MSDRKLGVVYLQRDRLHIYSPHLTSILELRFTPEVIRELDVINKENLKNLIKTFIVTSKIPPTDLIFVIADNASFIKDFSMPQSLPQQQKTATPVNEYDIYEEGENFIEHAPFENVVSKIFPLKNGIRVFVVNQEFYDSLKESFESNGFTVIAVLPGLALGNNLSSQPTLDQTIVHAALQKMNSLRQYNLLTQPTFIPETAENKESAESSHDLFQKPKINLRLLIMIGVFVVLVIFMVVLYLVMYPPKPAKKQISVQQSVPAVVNQTTSVTPIPTQANGTPVASPSGIDVKGLTIQINNTVSAQEAQQLKEQLLKLGFTTIPIQNQEAVGSSHTVITFSTNPSDTVKNAIIVEVNNLTPNPSVVVNKDSKFDISILLVK